MTVVDISFTVSGDRVAGLRVGRDRWRAGGGWEQTVLGEMAGERSRVHDDRSQTPVGTAIERPAYQPVRGRFIAFTDDRN